MRSEGKIKPIGRLFIMGCCSVCLYILLITKQDLISTYIGQGGVFAVLPVVTAFVFSYFHGTFTGDFWTVLGVEAATIKGGQ